MLLPHIRENFSFIDTISSINILYFPKLTFYVFHSLCPIGCSIFLVSLETLKLLQAHSYPEPGFAVGGGIFK